MQYKRCGLRNGVTEFCLMMPRPCPTAGQERTKSRGKALADTWRTKGKVDTWQTRFGGHSQSGHKAGHQADTGRDMALAQGGHMADTWRTKGKVDTWLKSVIWRTHGGQGLEARPKRTQGGHKADTRRTHSGHTADTRRTHGGHTADTWRTQGGQALGTASLFF